MATKAMSEMTDAELIEARDSALGRYNFYGETYHLILANQYDAELTRRREGKTT